VLISLSVFHTDLLDRQIKPVHRTCNFSHKHPWLPSCPITPPHLPLLNFEIILLGTQTLVNYHSFSSFLKSHGMAGKQQVEGLAARARARTHARTHTHTHTEDKLQKLSFHIQGSLKPCVNLLKYQDQF
jgi:hypothetical protein